MPRIIRAVEPPALANHDSTENIRLPDGRHVKVRRPKAGDIDESSGIALTDNRGRTRFYPVPVPNMALFTRERVQRKNVAFLPPRPAELVNHIGPFVVDENQVWFANQFYDGEGVSGVGAIGSFDLSTHQYNMRYLPEIVPWSGSALKAVEDDLWIGLMRQPEGAAYGAGVLRYNRGTQTTHVYPVHGYVGSIERSDALIFFGTEHGIYVFDTEKDTWRQVRVEPGEDSKPRVVTRLLSIR